jgi:hypothetical protein
MSRPTIEKEKELHSTRHVLLLLAGLLIPPLAWLAAIQAAFTLTDWGCEARQSWPLHAVAFGATALSLAAGFASFQCWIDLGAHWPTPKADPLQRSRMLAALGMALAALSVAGLIAHWIVNLVLSPCL